MMTRNTVLYRQLDDLQPQLEKLLVDILQQEAAGKLSLFISRLKGRGFDGRVYQRPEVEQIEDLANRVIGLKEKLGEPLEEGATGVILAYAELKGEWKSLYGQERSDFAMTQLQRLGDNVAVAPSTKSAKPSKPADNIAKPAKGRNFPLEIKEVVDLLHEMKFQHSQSVQRISVRFMNPDTETEFGTRIAALYPRDEIIIFSLPDDFPSTRAKALVNAAFKEFSEIDKDVIPVWNRQSSISYRTYFDGNRLIVTRRERSAKAAKYRGGAKFSNAFKPKGIKTNETVLKEINVT
jgi:hypothetical protein